ncbi:MAG: TIGR03545 family protein, partial [Spirochaetaceae bacterium]|nr:TIGR03545 family protein [Spirochaetaceae bacterium]
NYNCSKIISIGILDSKKRIENMKKYRIPGIFRKKHTPKAFNKKIIKRIYIPKDREMIKNLFKENSDGKMEIVREIPKDVLVRLKPLAKSIKKNKGIISRWKAFIVLFIIASILVFNLFFKDKLLTRAVETGLESVFQAKAEVNGLHLSLIHGNFSYQSLSIADADNTKRNLLIIGPSEFRVNITELLSKRIRIEEMSLTDFRWDTPRTVDGAMEASARDDQNGKSGKTDLNLDYLAVNKDDINLKVFLEEQKDNLVSLNLINQGNEEIETVTVKWKETYAEKNKKIELLSKDVNSLKSLSIKDAGSPAEGQAALKQITDLYSRVKETKTELAALKDEFETDREHLLEMNKLLKNAVYEDLSRLGSMIDLSSGRGRSLVSDAAEKYIRNRWNDYYEYGLKALTVYNRIKERQPKEMGEKKGLHRDSGRVFIFPGQDNPHFLIEHILVSGGDDSTGNLAAEIRSVSSEPDKLSKALTFAVDWKSSSSGITLNGFIDMRSKAERQFEMEIISPANFISLDEGLPSLQIKELSSMTDISGVSVVSDKQDGIITTLDISMKDIEIEQVDKAGLVSNTIKEILNDMDQVDFEAEILADSNGVQDIKVSSNIDNILVEKMGEYINEITAAKKEELKTELQNYIAPSLKENEVLNSSMEELGVESLDQIDSLNSMQNSLDAKQDEIQSDIKSGIKDEASKIIDQVPKLKLPGF